MKVRNRSGEYVDVQFDAIHARLKGLVTEAEADEVDLGNIVLMTIKGMYDGITTSELDGLSARFCAALLPVHPVYDELAGRIMASDMHKNLRALMRSADAGAGRPPSAPPRTTFSARVAHAAWSLPGAHNPQYLEFVRRHAERLDGIVSYARDSSLNDFALRTMECSYLLKDAQKRPLETPQDMLMRVSVALHMRSDDGEDDAGRVAAIGACYDMLSRGHASHATPTLFNAGMRTEQFASCFLLGTDDSLSAIFKTVADCAQISKWAGGIGVHVSNVRAKGSRIAGTNGESDGIIPMLKVFEQTARYCNQSGRRKGSIAVYLEPWHADVMEFVELRRNTGAETQRARDLFLALWVPDAFMRAVEGDEDWWLMSPDQSPGLVDAVGADFDRLYAEHVAAGRFVERVRAKSLWQHILMCQLETGTPYMMFKDHVNRKSNQSNLGTVRSSNLCVAPETHILTRELGYMPIAKLKDQGVQVWNGAEWSHVTVRQTGVAQPLLRVRFDNGEELHCTPYHKFHVTSQGGTGNPVEVEAQALHPGARVSPFAMPPAFEALCGWETPFRYDPYLHGLYSSADGTSQAVGDALGVRLPSDIADKYLVPAGHSVYVKLRWLEGLVDGSCPPAGYISNGPLHIFSAEPTFPLAVKRLINCLGADAGVGVDGSGGYRLAVCSRDLCLLAEAGLRPKRWCLDGLVGSDAGQQPAPSIQVTNVTDAGRVDDTYCFTEPLRNMGVFNGILARNCAEITEYSDADTYAVCTLGSIAVNRFYNTPACPGAYDFAALHAVAKQMTRNLDNIIDINAYPTPETRASNQRARPIGVGVQGLGDLYCRMMLPYDEAAALQLDSDVMETIYHGCLEASADLAEERGAPYPEFEGSPFSRGLLQFDHWGGQPAPLAPLSACGGPNDDVGGGGGGRGGPPAAGVLHGPVSLTCPWILDREALCKSGGGQVPPPWAELRARIMQSGTRNSLLTALMPTATTSQLMGNSEAFEPIHSNLYKRTTLAGEYMVVNTHLVREMRARGLWTEDVRRQLHREDGSVQRIAAVPDDIKRVFRTVWEVSQRSIVDHALRRGPFVDQSQSMNLYFATPNSKKLGAALMYGWKHGTKTGCYYVRSKSAAEAIKHGTGSSTSLAAPAPPASAVAAPASATAITGADGDAGPICRRDDPACDACGA